MGNSLFFVFAQAFSIIVAPCVIIFVILMIVSPKFRAKFMAHQIKAQKYMLETLGNFSMIRLLQLDVSF